jgi:hypothetical protein
LSDLFSIKDFLIIEKVNDKKSFIPLLYDPGTNIVKEPSFQKILTTPTNVKEGILYY